MKEGTVVGDTGEPENFFGKTNGNLMTFLPNYAERFVATGSGRQIGKNPGQHQPEIIRNAASAFCAQRAVFEMFFLICEDFLLFAKKFSPGKNPAEPEQNYEHDERNPKNASRFRLETHEFVVKGVVKMFLDIRRLRPSRRVRASCRRHRLRAQRCNCLRCGRAESNLPLLLEYRT